MDTKADQTSQNNASIQPVSGPVLIPVPVPVFITTTEPDLGTQDSPKGRRFNDILGGGGDGNVTGTGTGTGTGAATSIAMLTGSGKLGLSDLVRHRPSFS